MRCPAPPIFAIFAIAVSLAACAPDLPHHEPAAFDAFAAVDRAQLSSDLDEIVSLGERWSPEGKTKFRAWWLATYEQLGATTRTIPFPIAASDIDPTHDNGERTGHDVEAVFPGDVDDSLVFITHYDSVGLSGKERDNPGADDAGTGLAMLLQAARLFSTRPHHATLRFVAADFEEISGDLAGDEAYASALVHEAKAADFKILAAADDDQTGWSCWGENKCAAPVPKKDSTFRFSACSGDGLAVDNAHFADDITSIARTHGTIDVESLCDGAGDTDHYVFWERGIPGFVVEEHDADANPHYDDNDTGDDTLAFIDVDYFFHIAQPTIAFEAKLAGVR
jgi:hypothetical protein